jgi:hypothetical protein
MRQAFEMPKKVQRFPSKVDRWYLLFRPAFVQAIRAGQPLVRIEELPNPV